MASLLTSNDISGFTGVLEDHFDTFSKNITIHKEPIKEISSVSATNYVGYNDSSNTSNFTLIPVSGIYPAIVNYFNDQESEAIPELGGISVGKGVVRIKVKDDAKDFIKKGKTERIDIDEDSFNTITDEKVQNYLGSKYYVYYLERTE
tara:strand:+ start:31 stop:474 length:444 start_codon:yes stop_codon:yes gene_type:complete